VIKNHINHCNHIIIKVQTFNLNLLGLEDLTGLVRVIASTETQFISSIFKFMQKKFLFLRNVAIAFACIAVTTACGGGSKQQNQAVTSETTEQAKSAKGSVGSLDVSNLFKGCGLKDFVPPFATKLATIEGDANYAFFISDDFSNDQYNEWVQSLFSKVKAISEDGKVYEWQGDLAKTMPIVKVVGDEITQVNRETKLARLFSFDC
jgi:hypothetical protein